jgi:hypothetical protein
MIVKDVGNDTDPFFLVEVVRKLIRMIEYENLPVKENKKKERRLFFFYFFFIFLFINLLIIINIHFFNKNKS